LLSQRRIPDFVNASEPGFDASKLDFAFLTTHRKRWGQEVLKQDRFRRIDFWGMGPIEAANHCTSVFYRSNNCLGI